MMKNTGIISARQMRIVLLIASAIAFYLAYASLSGSLIKAKAANLSPLSGEWTAYLSPKHPGKVELNLTRDSTNGNFSNVGETYDIADLQGLPSLTTGTKTETKFSIIREAGTFACEGSFLNDRGTGSWTFTRDPAFASAMAKRGFGSLNDEDMLRAAFHNLTAKYADDIKAAGYDKLTFDELNRASSHDITVAYIRELRDAGFADLAFEDLIRASNHDVDGAFVRQVRDMGFGKQDMDSLIRMKNHDITPDFIAKMKAAGFENLSIDDLVRFESHDVTPEFVASIRAEGYTSLTADQAIRLKNSDIDRDLIRRAKAQGYNVSLDEIIRLKNRDLIK